MRTAARMMTVPGKPNGIDTIPAIMAAKSRRRSRADSTDEIVPRGNVCASMAACYTGSVRHIYEDIHCVPVLPLGGSGGRVSPGNDIFRQFPDGGIRKGLEAQGSRHHLPRYRRRQQKLKSD